MIHDRNLTPPNAAVIYTGAPLSFYAGAHFQL